MNWRHRGTASARPEIVTPAKAAAAVGAAAAAHGGMLAKTASVAALLASISGVVNTVLQRRAGLDQSRTPRERRAVVKVTLVCFFGTLASLGLLYGLRSAAFQWWEHRVVFAVICHVRVLAFIALWPVGMVRMMRFFRELRSAERQVHPECFTDSRDQVGSAAAEYCSRATLFGVPLVHVGFSTADDGDRPVFGWIAAGDRARGLLFAWGARRLRPSASGWSRSDFFRSVH